MKKLNQRFTYIMQKLINFTVIIYCQNVLKPTSMKYSHLTATSPPILSVYSMDLLFVCVSNTFTATNHTGTKCQAAAMK